jgi:hypothetical protein
VPLIAALDAAALAGTLNWLFLDWLRPRGPEAAEGAR